MIPFAKIHQFEVLYLISDGSLVSFHVPLSKVLDDWKLSLYVGLG